MAASLLSQRELNRATLARQLLLERVDLPPLAAIERVGGLQAQNVVSPYFGLWSRLSRFQFSDLTLLLTERTAVKATLMRGTLHLVSADDFLHMAPAIKPLLVGVLRGDLPPLEQLDGLIERILEHGSVPRTGPELREFADGIPEAANLNRAGLFWHARAHGPLLQVPPSGTWGHSGAQHFVHSRAWLGRDVVDLEIGLVRLVRRYLAAFGPATIADIRCWTGLNASAFRMALDALEPDLVRYVDERGRSLLDLRDAPRPAAETPAPVRLLPMWDSLLLGHDDRSRVLPDALRKIVIHKNGDVQRTFLIDGRVAGQWRLDLAARSAVVVLQPFGPLSTAARSELLAEAERFLAIPELERPRRDVRLEPF